MVNRQRISSVASTTLKVVRRLAALSLRTSVVVVVVACSTFDTNNIGLADGQPASLSQPVRWKLDQTCIAKAALAPGATRDAVASNCYAPGERDFVGLALSGGGTKAAVFSAESMFYLQALGLLQKASMVSSVSGGSFAAALYGLSCDPTDAICAANRPRGRERPLWLHEDVLRTMGQGYGEVVGDQIGRLFVPIVSSSVSAARFASIIDRSFLGARGGGSDGPPFRFSDLSPRRPRLFLNSTIVSDNRVGLGDGVAIKGCTPLTGRHYLRRRTPDEFFHFSFSDYYFGLLHSSIDDYPLAAGVAASAAFPVLIDQLVLTDHCNLKDDNDKIRLMDGGANDNQGLIEVYAVIAELAYGQHRSDSWNTPEAMRERMGPRDRAWVFVINSSVTEATGTASSGNSGPSLGLIGLLSGAIDKSLAAIDVYSAEGYNLRRQAYLAQKALADRGSRELAQIRLKEISLTGLDQYAVGGTSAALRDKAGVRSGETADLGQTLDDASRVQQAEAYRMIMKDPGTHRDLGLSDWHPQCYFDLRAQLDASLISVSDDGQACLRDAARWATALRAQEICSALAAGEAAPAGMSCAPDHSLKLPLATVLQDKTPLKGQCGNLIRPMLERSAARLATERSGGLSPLSADVDVACKSLSATPAVMADR